MIQQRRYLWIAAAALVLLGLVAFLAAPVNNRLLSGSTWGHAPDGYGAWYTSMVEQQAPIQRWQRPIAEFLEVSAHEPATLMQILPRPVSADQVFAERFWLEDWLVPGHTLVILGLAEPVTRAPFTVSLPTAAGRVQVQTRRRRSPDGSFEPLLADEYGAIGWQQSRQGGRVIAATTPFLGANAYLNEPGNFAFLAELVADSGPIYIDEYLHGYRDSDVLVREVAGSWLSYLAQTPLGLLAVQVGIVGLVVLLAQNRRPGSRRRLTSPRPSDSEAYMQALAGVLSRADSRDFLIEILLRSERQVIQRELGLGDGPIADGELRSAWQAKGRPASDLDCLSKPARNCDLKSWLRGLYG
ncbi:DUF4350 domain-containing protein, partial [filamentous cyanobacterium CCP5]